MIWQFINTGRREGVFNMEYDEGLARRLADGTGAPTVRVYGWQPFAISLGYHQKESDINSGQCREDGIDIVRRPTGGRAILHAHELTYSVVMPADGRSVADTYEHISLALAAALRRLGVDVNLARGAVNFAELYRSSAAVSCFASTSRSEIQWRGRKIVGSAQRRYASDRGTILLQHGSILLGLDHRRLADYIVPSAPRAAEIIRLTLEQKTIEVETILGRPVSFEEAADAVAEGFEEAWGIRFAAEETLLHA